MKKKQKANKQKKGIWKLASQNRVSNLICILQIQLKMEKGKQHQRNTVAIYGSSCRFSRRWKKTQSVGTNRCLLCPWLNLAPTVNISCALCMSQYWCDLFGMQIFSLSDRWDHWSYPGCLQDARSIPEVITCHSSDLITFPVGSALPQGNTFNCHFALLFWRMRSQEAHSHLESQRRLYPVWQMRKRPLRHLLPLTVSFGLQDGRTQGIIPGNIKSLGWIGTAVSDMVDKKDLELRGDGL